jgi:DNA-binding HxlR family transcriptional regulator
MEQPRRRAGKKAATKRSEGHACRSPARISVFDRQYRLSPLGQSRREAVMVLDRWAERNFPALDAARDAGDARR